MSFPRRRESSIIGMAGVNNNFHYLTFRWALSLHIKSKASIAVFYPSFFLNISLTTLGLALPLVCFITWPTKKPISFLLPPR